jgi:hypothetical protein
MPKPVKELVRVKDGKLVRLTLVEWAERFNADHRLNAPKAAAK